MRLQRGSVKKSALATRKAATRKWCGELMSATHEEGKLTPLRKKSSAEEITMARVVDCKGASYADERGGKGKSPERSKVWARRGGRKNGRGVF